MKCIPIIPIVLAVTFGFVACGQSVQNESGFDLPFRSTGVVGYTQDGKLFTEQAVPAPVTVFANVYLHNGPDPPLQNRIAKVEMDFGDSGGWVDVTSAIRMFNEDQLFNVLPSHTYTIPGNYHIAARLTMNWGEILYSESSAEPNIIVLPPEDAGS
ncbi:MAG: hypothetical protein HRF49_05360 [bacterium]